VGPIDTHYLLPSTCPPFSIFAIRSFEAIQVEGRRWLEQTANVRIHSEIETHRKPSDAFAQEKPLLKSLAVMPNECAVISTPANENLYDGQWHHLAATCVRGGKITTYVDGVKEDASAFPLGVNTFDTDEFTTDSGDAYAVNIGQDGTGAYTQGPTSNPPPVMGGTAGRNQRARG
jgi:hypothetical protein